MKHAMFFGSPDAKIRQMMDRWLKEADVVPRPKCVSGALACRQRPVYADTEIARYKQRVRPATPAEPKPTSRPAGDPSRAGDASDEEEVEKVQSAVPVAFGSRCERFQQQAPALESLHRELPPGVMAHVPFASLTARDTPAISRAFLPSYGLDLEPLDAPEEQPVRGYIDMERQTQRFVDLVPDDRPVPGPVDQVGAQVWGEGGTKFSTTDDPRRQRPRRVIKLQVRGAEPLGCEQWPLPSARSTSLQSKKCGRPAQNDRDTWVVHSVHGNRGKKLREKVVPGLVGLERYVPGPTEWGVVEQRKRCAPSTSRAAPQKQRHERVPNWKECALWHERQRFLGVLRQQMKEAPISRIL